MLVRSEIMAAFLTSIAVVFVCIWTTLVYDGSYIGCSSSFRWRSAYSLPPGSAPPIGSPNATLGEPG